MQNYIFFTDSSCDLPAEVFDTEGAEYYGLFYTIDGTIQLQHSLKDILKAKEFYTAMKNGKLPRTSQITTEEFKTAWEPILQKGKDILYYGISSGLSGTYSSALLAANELIETYKGRRIEVVDSLGGSGILGLPYYLGLIKYKQGTTIDEMKTWLEYIKTKVCGLYTADDLFHLKRGGRISTTSASLGTLLDIKPLLTMNKTGHVEQLEKIKTRKKVFKRMVQILSEHQIKNAGELSHTIHITHGDCLEDALALKDSILEANNHIKNVIISGLGPIIGAHLGPNCLGLNFIGNERLA